MAISAPASANLGSASSPPATISAQLGTVTVTGTGGGLLFPSFTATVSTTAFTTGGGSPHETIPRGAIRYWSGPATAVSGALGTGTPGQPTAAQAVSLSTDQAAFSASGTALSLSVSWNPTLVIQVPESAVAGTYTGTITHSAA